MVSKKKSSPFFIGMALFSMFFGSGNLTFPLFLGQLSGKEWNLTTYGFLISAVLLPFLGVLAMVINNGDTNTFFSKTGRFFGGKWLAPILLTVWIPLGSGPRCITVAHASLTTYLHNIPLWSFSLVYSTIIFILIYRRQKLLDILGYILTPLLLISLLILVIAGIMNFPADGFPPSNIPEHPIFKGLLEGYNTMDLIASCFFSVSIIKLMNTSKRTSLNTKLSLLLKSSIIGISILAIVYISLIYLSASHANYIGGLEKEQILPYLACLLLGSKLGVIASMIVLLACITTSSVLTIVYFDYIKSLRKDQGKENSFITAIILTVIFLFSLIGFNGITILCSPMLQVLYPILITLVLATISKRIFLIFNKKWVRMKRFNKTLPSQEE